MVDGVDDQRRKVARLGDLGCGRRVHFRHSLADDPPIGVLDARVEQGDRLFALLTADDGDLHLVADMNAAQEAQVLSAIERACAGQQIAEHRGDEGANPHRRRDRLALLRAVFRQRQHERIDVARGVREQKEILHGAASLEARGVADLEFGPRLVSDRGFSAHVRLLNPKGRFNR